MPNHNEIDKPMHPRRSFHKYPRPDNVYTHKSSLNFDMMRAKIFLDRKGTKMDAYVWLVHLITGLSVGFFAFLLSTCEDNLVEFRKTTVQKLLDHHTTTFVQTFFFYSGIAVMLVFFACILTIYVGPGANGSGIAELMGVLNGINYPDVIGFRTLFVKMVGTLFAVSGGLCIGKEGPLAHIGANVGVMACYLPIKGFKCLQNDVTRR